jgi:hypothetical protein
MLMLLGTAAPKATWFSVYQPDGSRIAVRASRESDFIPLREQMLL